MTTADYALIISLVSAAVALASFVWSVWSTFLYPKARLRVSFAVGCIVRTGAEHDFILTGSDRQEPEFLSLGITNFGPTAVRVEMAWSSRRAGWLGRQYGPIYPMRDPLTPGGVSHPFSGGLPRQLEVGQSMAIYFPFSPECFARHGGLSVGVRDVFGRNHWAPPRAVRAVRRKLNEAFAGYPLHPIG